MPVTNNSFPTNRVINSNRQRYSSSNLSFPTDIGPHGMLLVFKNYSFSGGREAGFPSVSEISTGDSVLLPIPRNLIDNTSLNVQTQRLGILGDQIASAAEDLSHTQTLGEMTSALGDVVQRYTPSGQDVANITTEIIRNVTGSSAQTNHIQNLSSQIAFILRRTVGSLPGIENADIGIGSVVNPKSALAFEGVNLKMHSFSWELMVSSQEDNDALKTIVEVIKRNSLPSYIGLGAGGTNIVHRALLKYPSMVDVFLIGVDPSYYYQFKTSLVTNVSVNYNPQNNHIIMAGGKPGAVTIDIQMTEMDIHTAEDYGGGSNPGIGDGS